MHEVQKKILLVMLIVPIFLSGCVTTPKSYKIYNDRIEFLNYSFSIKKPPNDFKIVEKTTKNQLVRWENDVSDTIIEISVEKLDKNESYHFTAEIIAESFLKAVYQKLDPNASYEILEEKEVFYGNKKFLKSKIRYYTQFFSGNFQWVVYFHKTEDSLYNFTFIQERRGIITEEMMKSLVFWD
jgi:hypothetical protein